MQFPNDGIRYQENEVTQTLNVGAGRVSNLIISGTALGFGLPPHELEQMFTRYHRSWKYLKPSPALSLGRRTRTRFD